MSAQLLTNAVCVTIQFALLAWNARLYQRNTQAWRRRGARVFVRLRRVNVGLMLFLALCIIGGLLTIAGEVGV